MMELSGKELPSLSGPACKYGTKSIFRLCLFLDIWIMVYKLQYAVYGCLVMLEKIDGLLFLDHSRSDQSLFLDC